MSTATYLILSLIVQLGASAGFVWALCQGFGLRNKPDAPPARTSFLYVLFRTVASVTIGFLTAWYPLWYDNRYIWPLEADDRLGFILIWTIPIALTAATWGTIGVRYLPQLSNRENLQLL